MVEYLAWSLLIFAVSFSIGITYGIKRILVPTISLFIIMICSGFSIGFSMFFGDLFNSYFSEKIAEILGGSILIGLGCFFIINILKNKEKIHNIQNTTLPQETHPSLKKNLSKPQRADLDQSGTIAKKEALILG